MPAKAIIESMQPFPLNTRANRAQAAALAVEGLLIESSLSFLPDKRTTPLTFTNEQNVKCDAWIDMEAVRNGASVADAVVTRFKQLLGEGGLKHWCKHESCKGRFTGFATAAELKAHRKEKHGEE